MFMMQVGLAIVDITPRSITGISLGGYNRSSTCKGIHDPIFARIMVIKADANASPRLVLINLDQPGLSFMVAERLKQRLHEKFGFPINIIYIYCTHSHYAPDVTGVLPSPVFPTVLSPIAVNYTYIHYLIAKIAVSIPKALQTFPARIAVYQDRYPARDLRDRRANLRQQVKWVHPHRTILAVKDTADEIRALLMVLPMHDTIIERSDNQITAGLTGQFCKACTTLTAHQTHPAIGFFLQGPAGDVGPDSNPEAWKLIRARKEIQTNSWYDYTEGWGLLNAQKCLEIAKGLRYSEYLPEITSQYILIPLRNYYNRAIPGWFFTHLGYMAVKKLYAIPGLTLLRNGRPLFVNIVWNKPTRIIAGHNSHTWLAIRTQVSILKIGDLLLLNCPGEPFLEMGRRIEANALQSRKDITKAAVVELCNDCMGYLWDDQHTIDFLDGYEPSMGFTSLTGLYLRKWYKILLQRSHD